MGTASKVIEALTRPSEMKALVYMYLETRRIKRLVLKTPHHQFCYDMINKVSRSFAVVIQQLPERLRDAVCVFYLVLRALDTVEDDMALAKDIKLPLLHQFHEKISDKEFRFEDCGSGDYKVLLQEFPLVTEVLLSLSERYQAVIKDITKRMGDGMAEFINKEVVTVDDYDKYCHYVAGVVGIGLCHLFAASGCEDKRFATSMDDLANDMGLFLQKTNIIRDYLEDINEEPAPRMFWPKEIWSKYAGSLEAFKEPENREDAIKCLNHMVADALRHAPRCIEYMAQVQDPAVFSFCAIPQVMAIATLSLCYDNGRVFEGVVKMRRGEAALVVEKVRGMGSVCQYFNFWAAELEEKVRAAEARGDPTAATAFERIKELRLDCVQRCKKLRFPAMPQDKSMINTVMVVIFIVVIGYVINARAVNKMVGLPTSEEPTYIRDILMACAAMSMLVQLVALL